ncbi:MULTISPECIES: gluconate 2-dehydrogenase subunit 3 family protein [Hymenobacter]|uniref:Gluconate 2-dehydrogenase subunit 3 family protein n=2 Tax=Hymenobacter TaxID=89966 RepID=A0ABS6WWQ0_9BACT|nr:MULTISPECIES: gluconate 2-dehydrogenase subunit 3 family protein [Hymenobacter]MBO3270089.1 gluconate 2-dehydrogenase subunit 3 family protein [Hymenobacter defluvii]MBW3128022.1 gluconate 2-dehydrogenase subunit 3 family protein [Hymenobacter profundi]
MNRRDALGRVALLMGGAVIGGDLFLTGCSTDNSKTTAKAGPKGDQKPEEVLDANQVTLLNEVGETILPATKTPGAKAANVGGFMAVMVRDCYKPEDQKIFSEGITKLNDASKQKYQKDFMGLDAGQRKEFLTALDAEQKQYAQTKTKEQPNHYFRMMKELTLLGFFTSEPGATQALRYLPVPGKYDGNVPYKKGDRAWAT